MLDALEINHAAFSYYDRLGRVKRYVERHYRDEDLSLAKLASVAGLERRYFSSFFHDKTGVRLMDWITHLRIREAIEMMKVHNYSISRIGSSVGYQDLRTFERAFKRCTNQTPSAFKKTIRPS